MVGIVGGVSGPGNLKRRVESRSCHLKNASLLLAAPRVSILEAVMKRPLLVSQGSLSRMLQAASESWKRQDFRQCVEILERASRLDHANINVLLDLGRAQGLC